jgi:hypothetical protein
MFKDGQTRWKAKWSAIISEDLVQGVEQKISEIRRFTVPEISCEFPQISRTVV